MSFQMEYDASLLKNMGILFALAVLSYLISIVLAHFLLHQKEGYDLAVEKFAVTYTNCGFIGIPLGYAVLAVSALFTPPFLLPHFIFFAGPMASCFWIPPAFSPKS